MPTSSETPEPLVTIHVRRVLHVELHRMPSRRTLFAAGLPLVGLLFGTTAVRMFVKVWSAIHR